MTQGGIGKEPFFGWRNVTICFISYGLIYGCVFYGYSVIFPTMVKAMGWQRGDASIAQTVRALFTVFLGPVIGYAIIRWGVRKTMLSGGFMLCLALVLLGTVVSKSDLWLWTLLWGVLGGAGFGFLGPLVHTSVATYWFNKYKGTAMGLIFTGGAVGGFIGNPLFTWIMSKVGTWQMGWISAALCSFVAVAIVIWLKTKPEDYGQHKDGISPEKAQAMADAAGAKKKALTYRTAHNFELSEAIKTRQLWILIFCVLMQYSALVLLVAHGVFHFTDQGLTRMQAAYIISFNLLGGAFARIPVGWLSDRIEGRWLLIVGNALMFITMAIIWKSNDLTTLAVASTIFGFAYGATYTLVPLVVGSYYGVPNFPKILGFMLPIEYGIGALVPVTAGYIHQIFKSYDYFFVGLLTLLFVSVIVTFAATPPKRTA